MTPPLNERLLAMGMLEPLRLYWFVDDYHCFVVRGKECKIWIDARPPLCDRGRFIANIDAHGMLARDLDHQDGWPRYYFNLAFAMREIEAWLFNRKQA